MRSGGAIAQGLGDMNPSDRLGAVEIGQRARHLEDAVIAADRNCIASAASTSSLRSVGINTSLTLFGEKLVTGRVGRRHLWGARDAEPDATNKRNPDRT
jgi:hypothetical protein